MFVFETTPAIYNIQLQANFDNIKLYCLIWFNNMKSNRYFEKKMRGLFLVYYVIISFK